MDGDAGPNRWLMLALGWAAQASTCLFLYGLASLVPVLRADRGLALSRAELLVAAPSIGLLLTLIAWGFVVDRHGERWTIAVGLGGAGLVIMASAALGGLYPTLAAFVVAGGLSASVNAASGRVVMGWFSAEERGLAMGIRQTAQPLGVGLAAIVLPPVAEHWHLSAALLVAGGICVAVAVAVAVLVVDPPRAARAPGAERPASPYRRPALWRIHAGSTLLVVPQFAISAFALDYFVSERHWSSVAAGRVVFVGQVAGALGRIAAGWWSDRVRSRLGPMRQLAVLSALVMLAVAAGDRTGSALVLVAFLAGAVVTVADNGLGFTAVAEIAGADWSGRALGAQNTAQNIAAALTPPLLAGLVTHHGYAWAFSLAAVFPLLAIPVTPVQDDPVRATERELSSSGSRRSSG